MVSEPQLRSAVTSSIFLPTFPGRFEALDIPYVKGRYGLGVQGGFINRVSGSTFSVEQMAATVQAVIAHYETLNQSFSWFVASSDRPAQLAGYLEQSGFERGSIFSGKAFGGLHREIATRPDVTVRPAAPGERHLVSAIYQTGFVPDKAAADLFADMPRIKHYLVFLEGVDDPVGATASFYIENQQVVVLEAALILEAYRGQGIYNSLVAQRLRDAHADGMRIAVVQAKATTSAPGLHRLGFTEKCTFESWRWSLRNEPRGH